MIESFMVAVALARALERPAHELHCRPTPPRTFQCRFQPVHDPQTYRFRVFILFNRSSCPKPGLFEEDMSGCIPVRDRRATVVLLDR